MPCCILKNFCCYIDLRTGCFIIGYLNLIWEIILMILFVFGLTIGIKLAKTHSRYSDADVSGAFIITCCIVSLLIISLFLGFTIVLLIGVHKKKREYVKAYLIVAFIYMVLTFISFLVSFAGTANVGFEAFRIISTVLNVYFTLVIRSYYYKMDDKRPAVNYTA